MSSLLHSLRKFSCICGRETVSVGDRRFYVRTRLGEGGFSYVDLVEDVNSKTLYALKRMSCHSKRDEDIALAEVRYMTQFRHPNLVPCEVHTLKKFSSHVASGATSEVLIVMPFYKKGSLWDEIEISKKTGVSIQEKRILEILLDVCDGLEALHRRSPDPVAHRDIKPHNVMLDVDETAVLMDFGSMAPADVVVSSSRQAQDVQDTAAERCTMPYRSPELFHVETGHHITEKVDIWSLGCTLYALCFHESPFDEAYQKGGSIALAVLSGKIKIPENHSYSHELMNLMLSMLKIEAADRPDVERVKSQTKQLLHSAKNQI